MYRLTDDVAQCRRTYPPPVFGSGFVVLLDLPPAFRGPGLTLDRFYPVIAESEAERDEFEAFLGLPRTARTRPDLLDRRPSSLCSDALIVTRYEPPGPGWPWLIVCRWPESFSKLVRSDARAMARGCYTFEAFVDEDSLIEHQIALLASLQRHRDLVVRFIAADVVGNPGSA